MAYIGKQPLIGNFQVCDAISTVNGQAAYTLQVGGANVSPETANNMIVSVNGVIQKPNISYTVSGSTITFTSNLVTGDVIDFIQILGSVLDLGTPSDATVTAAKLASNAVDTQALALFNASGSAPVYACRAWVNFNGTSTVAIRASGNVSSITDNGTGDYTVNFTTAMPDANYATSAFAAQESGTDNNVTCVGQKATIASNYTTSLCRLQMRRLDGVTLDINLVTAIFVR